MSFTAEQKSQLAKLLATENLTVQHQKIHTAKFDPQNRILYLPIWQNMTGVIYDLLVGHEVGHALYTPAEGWHDAVTGEDKNRNYKNFLNVVEDARIEKKVKRKYPGLNSAFRVAYQDLMNRDFFGIKGRDVNEMPFIDRLNLFSKSQWNSTWIKFSANEGLLVKEVQAAESWDDVLRITEKIYQYSKDEQHEMALEYYDEMMAEMSDEDGDGEYDMSDYDDMEGDDDSGQAQGDQSEESFEDGESRSKRSQASDEDGDEYSDEYGNNIQHDKLSAPGDKDQFDPSCQTDENYRRNETQLLDDNCKDFIYVDIPTPNLDAIITPAKRVHELMSVSYKTFANEGYFKHTKGLELLNEFKRRNERYVGLLAKEFEMRKAAKAFSKSKLSDTGDIDINKLSSYKFDDNIFRKVMMTPKGKSHGLVLLLDRSGSMSKNMSGSIEQILVLSMFCRKVNIPFVVYGFTESAAVRCIDTGAASTYESQSKFANSYNFDQKHFSFSRNENEMSLSNVHLREYLNSKMSNAEFTGAMKNMCILMESYKEEFCRFMPRPESEQLNNTPMTEAIIATAKIMKDFKRQHNLDITSLVVVHDGDADNNNCYFKKAEVTDYRTGEKMVKITPTHYSSDRAVYYLRDRQNKFEVKLNQSYNDIPQNILKWFTKVTDARIFGFFIVEGRGEAKYAVSEKYLDEKGQNFWQIKNEIGYEAAEIYRKKLIKEFKSEKFLATKLPGFETFFLIHGGSELTTEDEDGIEVEGKFTAKKLATAFAKYNKKRAVNRVLVSRFIQGIAA